MHFTLWEKWPVRLYLRSRWTFDYKKFFRPVHRHYWSPSLFSSWWHFPDQCFLTKSISLFRILISWYMQDCSGLLFFSGPSITLQKKEPWSFPTGDSFYSSCLDVSMELELNTCRSIWFRTGIMIFLILWPTCQAPQRDTFWFWLRCPVLKRGEPFLKDKPLWKQGP